MQKLVILLIFLLEIRSNLFRKVVIKHPEALCLDGTPSVFYYHPGHPKKIMINFQEGGWCGSPSGNINDTLLDCYQRSHTFYGSSSAYTDTVLWSRGIMSDNKENMFRDWTFFHLKYCTGTGYQGYKTEPITFMNKKLYFRGQKVVQALLQNLVSNYSLLAAEEVVVFGGSAGGLATFLWANKINELVGGNKTKVIADSGIFLDFPQFNTNHHAFRLLIQSFMKLVNQQVNPPNTECINVHQLQKWKCLFVQFNQAFVVPPLFVVQSLYDSWCLSYILNVHCLRISSLAACKDQQLAFIEQHHANTTNILKKIGSKKINGVWAPACSNHCYNLYAQIYSNNFAVPQKSNFTAMNSIREWYYNSSTSNMHLEDVDWPKNQPCADLPYDL